MRPNRIGVFCISIHAPVKGATPFHIYRHLMTRYFNPRSREGSDKWSNEFLRVVLISIHAPVEGATIPGLSVHIVSRISIHAPVKGATLIK